MGSKSNRNRRYSEEFKRDAVALVRSSGKTVTAVAGRSGSVPRSCRTGSSRTKSIGARGLRAS
ncbi:transposase [Streptomyces sp. NPDC059349]|uniref:transposase n=1 Tax=Streptomyces sp. NPDC059349 TaxID=3346808 RepID=UPI00367FCF30